MKKQKLILILLLLLLAVGIVLRIPEFSVSAKDLPYVTTSELIAGVNGLRTSNGQSALTADNLLMISAQSHSEYQASLGYWTHEGPGGTNETDRAYAVGYGSGATVKCDEAVAIASPNKDVNYIVYDLWGDYVHRDVVLLNSSYVHIGAGVAEGSDGLYYYTVDLCVVSGAYTANPTTANGDDSGSTVVNGPTATYEPLITATPVEDGSIWHLVKAGETLFDISVAYGVAILDIETMNGISPDYQRIYEGELLLIKMAPTPTITPTVTGTPKPPTRTPRPTATPRPTRVTSTPQATATVTPTATAIPAYYEKLDQFTQRQWGMMIIGVSLLGILLMFGRELKKIKFPKKPKKLDEGALDTPEGDEPITDESLDESTMEPSSDQQADADEEEIGEEFEEDEPLETSEEESEEQE